MKGYFQAPREHDAVCADLVSEGTGSGCGSRNALLASLLELLPERIHPLLAPDPDTEFPAAELERCLSSLAAFSLTAPMWQLAAEGHAALEEPEEALACLQRALFQSPTQANSLYDLWWLQYWENRDTEARATAERLRSLFPDDAEACVLHGRSLSATGDEEQAETVFRRALALEPDHWHALLCLSQRLHSRGMDADALALAARAASLHPASSGAHFLTGLILRRLDRRVEALASFDRCLAVCEAHEDAHRMRVLTLSELGRAEEALRRLEESAVHIGEMPDVSYLRSRLLHEMGLVEEALDAADAGLLFDGDHALLHWQRGTLLQHLGRWRDSREAFHRAIRLEPDNPSNHLAIAETLEELDSPQRAAAAFERALVFDPKNATAMYRAAVARTKAGNFPQALMWLKRAVQEDASLRSHALRDQDMSIIRSHPDYAASFEEAVASPDGESPGDG